MTTLVLTDCISPDNIDALEASFISRCSIYRQVIGNNFELLEVPECSFSGTFFRHDHMQTYQEQS
jgi:hypothetical protein